MRNVLRSPIGGLVILFLTLPSAAASEDNVRPSQDGHDLDFVDNVPISGSYQCRDNSKCDFSEFIKSVCALVVVKDSIMVFRHFSKERKCTDGEVGAAKEYGLASLTKSITSTLIGMLHTDPAYGPLNLDDEMATIEARFGEIPGALTFRNALSMRGGLIADDFDKYSQLHDHTVGDTKPRMTFLEAINTYALKDEAAEPGKTFLYSNMTAAILGTALEAQLREKGPPDGPKTLDKALEQWIWHPFKMGGGARWKTDKDGSPSPYCCFYMRAYDLAKFGEFVLRQLTTPGARLQEWLRNASTDETGPVTSPCFSQGERFLLGYGYQWWVFRNTDLGFTGYGTAGQFLHIIPKSNVVIVQLSKVKRRQEEAFKCRSWSAHKLIQDFLDQ